MSSKKLILYHGLYHLVLPLFLAPFILFHELHDGEIELMILMTIIVFMASSVLFYKIRKIHAQEIKQHNLQQEKQLQNQAKMRAQIGHQIKTPLGGIIGAAELLLKTDLTSNQKKYIALINGSGTTIMNTITDIIDIGKIENNDIEIEYDDFFLHRMLKTLEQELLEIAQEKKIDFKMDISSDVPWRVAGDERRIQQALLYSTRYILNQTKNGITRLKIDALRTSTYTAQVCFEMYNTDQPLNICHPEFIQKITTENKTEKNIPDNDLRLYLSNALIHRMEGTIRYETRPEHLFNFWMVLHLPVTAFDQQNSLPHESTSGPDPLYRLLELR